VNRVLAPINRHVHSLQVLNATLRGELDMSQLTREMLEKNLLSDLTNTESPQEVTTTGGDTIAPTTSSDYSSGDFTSDSSSPLATNDKLLASAGEDDENSFSISSPTSPDSDVEANKKVRGNSSPKILDSRSRDYFNNRDSFVLGKLVCFILFNVEL